MFKKSLIATAIALFGLSASISSHAGFNSLTFHSRANCGNNETISWWAGHNFSFNTYSNHLYSGGVNIHAVITGWQTTWRSAAVHWGEGTGRWTVDGYHWMMIGSQQTYMTRTLVNDCSIYDGWWD